MVHDVRGKSKYRSSNRKIETELIYIEILKFKVKTNNGGSNNFKLPAS